MFSMIYGLLWRQCAEQVQGLEAPIKKENLIWDTNKFGGKAIGEKKKKYI